MFFHTRMHIRTGLTSITAAWDLLRVLLVEDFFFTSYLVVFQCEFVL